MDKENLRSLAVAEMQASMGMVSVGKSVETACKLGGVTHFLQPRVHLTTTASSKSGTS